MSNQKSSGPAYRSSKSFGLIVSGGPAPGINSVISSAVIAANNHGYSVKGLMNGFRGLSTGEPNSVVELTTPQVSSIYNKGGSILGTSRYNPWIDPATRDRFISGLKENDIDKLIVIGGEGSAFLSLQISKMHPELSVVHVPKTIDNDLILPNKYPSFGFESALAAGTKILDTLREDAKTCRRWFIITTMGRNAGFLALGLGLAAGATASIIPEEFKGKSSKPEDIARIIVGSIKKRIEAGKAYGTVVIAEGVLDCLNPQESDRLRAVTRDELGRIRYSQIELSDVILPPLKDMLHKESIDAHLITKNIGYELRCCQPISFDIEYTKFLGYGAVKQTLDGKSGIMITRDFDRLGYQSLEEMQGPDGNIRSRKVDISSDLYRVARSFMIR